MGSSSSSSSLHVILQGLFRRRRKRETEHFCPIEGCSSTRALTYLRDHIRHQHKNITPRSRRRYAKLARLNKTARALPLAQRKLFPSSRPSSSRALEQEDNFQPIFKASSSTGNERSDNLDELLDEKKLLTYFEILASMGVKAPGRLTKVERLGDALSYMKFSLRAVKQGKDKREVMEQIEAIQETLQH